MLTHLLLAASPNAPMLDSVSLNWVVWNKFRVFFEVFGLEGKENINAASWCLICLIRLFVIKKNEWQREESIINWSGSEMIHVMTRSALTLRFDWFGAKGAMGTNVSSNSNWQQQRKVTEMSKEEERLGSCSKKLFEALARVDVETYVN